MFKKYTSIFFLLLFLFPLAEKELHALEHSDDFHCTSLDKHFHEQEHSCSICDYNVSVSNTPVDQVWELALPVIAIFLNSSSESIFLSAVYTYSSPRAPPVV